MHINSRPNHMAIKLETNRTHHDKQRDGTPTQLLRGHWLPRGLIERKVAHPASLGRASAQQQHQHQPSPWGDWGSSLCSSHLVSVSSTLCVQLLAPTCGQQEQCFTCKLQSTITHGGLRVFLREPLTDSSKSKTAAAMQTRGR